jgi:hypothetical protein
MFQGNLLEPKKGKTVGSAADMTIEYLIDILTYISCKLFRLEGFVYVWKGLMRNGYGMDTSK